MLKYYERVNVYNCKIHFCHILLRIYIVPKTVDLTTCSMYCGIQLYMYALWGIVIHVVCIVGDTVIHVVCIVGYSYTCSM